jgi:hypothetical protein
LTALKSLGVLKLRDSVAGSINHVTALLPKLPQLWDLNIHCAGLTSLRQLSGLSKLTCVNSLTLQGWDTGAAMEEVDLQLLQPLTKLTELSLGLLQQCSEEALEVFKKSMPRMKRLVWWSVPVSDFC